MATVHEIPLPVPVAQRGPRTRIREPVPAALLLLAPALIVLGVFHFFPLLYAFYISLHKWRFVDQGFVGLDNYMTALTSDALWLSLANTVFFVIMVVPTTMILAPKNPFGDALPARSLSRRVPHHLLPALHHHGCRRRRLGLDI